jgi:hypothetical protein
MTYIPVKGSAMPPVPGPNIFETAYLAAVNLITKIPVSAGLQSEIGIVEAALSSALQAVDPDGQKANERTAILDAAYTLTQSTTSADVTNGIAQAATFAQDAPAHPTPWVRRARWIVVNAGGSDPLPGGA